MCCHLSPLWKGIISERWLPQGPHLWEFSKFVEFQLWAFLKGFSLRNGSFSVFLTWILFSPPKSPTPLPLWKQTQSVPVDHAGSKSLFLSLSLSRVLSLFHTWYLFSWIKLFRNYLPSNNPKLPLTCNTYACSSFILLCLF